MGDVWFNTDFGPPPPPATYGRVGSGTFFLLVGIFCALPLPWPRAEFIGLILAIILLPEVLRSEIWPQVLTGLIVRYTFKWLWQRMPDLRRHRGPADRDSMAREPTTKVELKQWLFRHTHETLPTEDQSLEFYQALYNRSRAAVAALAAAPAAAPARARSMPTPPRPALRFVTAAGNGLTAVPFAGRTSSAATVLGGIMLGGVATSVGRFGCEYLERWGACSTLMGVHAALDPVCLLRAFGCALGAWSIAAVSPLGGPLRAALPYAITTAVLLNVSRHALLSAAIVFVARLVPPWYFYQMYVWTLRSELVSLAASVSFPTAAAFYGLRRHPSPRPARLKAPLLLCLAISYGLVPAAVGTAVTRPWVTTTARHVCHGEWGAAWRILYTQWRLLVWPDAELVAEEAGQEACRVLGVTDGSDPSEFRSAYRRLIRRWHPDKLPPSLSAEERLEAAEKFSQIQEAHETLLKQHKERSSEMADAA